MARRTRLSIRDRQPDFQVTRACLAAAPEERRRGGQGPDHAHRADDTGRAASGPASRLGERQNAQPLQVHTWNMRGGTDRIQRKRERTPADSRESAPSGRARRDPPQEEQGTRGPQRVPAGWTRVLPRRQAARNSRSRSAKGASNNSRRGMTTRSIGAPGPGSSRLNTSRINRLARFLRTASPSFREATIPSRDVDAPLGANRSVK